VREEIKMWQGNKKDINMSSIKLFESKKVRSEWDAEKEIWYFSIVDIVGILTDQPSVDRARNYWKVLKNRLLKEGNETVTNCNQLKLRAEDGKLRLTDVGNVQDIFRLVQSMPSPKAEPFKQWLAKVGYEPCSRSFSDSVMSVFLIRHL
jgi:DNA-damage-inducible protein D